jgi:hypothetical protein
MEGAMKVPWKEPWRCHGRSLEGAIEGALKVPWKEPWRSHGRSHEGAMKPLGAWWWNHLVHGGEATWRMVVFFGTPSENLKSLWYPIWGPQVPYEFQVLVKRLIFYKLSLPHDGVRGCSAPCSLCCMCFHSWRMALTWLCFVMLQASYACVLSVKDDITLMSVRVVIRNT